MKRKIKVIKGCRLTSPRTILKVGEIVEVEEQMADALVQRGHAEKIKAGTQPNTQPQNPPGEKGKGKPQENNEV